MTDNKELYQEAFSNHKTSKITDPNGITRVLYLGFCLKPCGDIQDMRHEEFYRPITKKDLAILKERGFIIGANYLTFLRDCKRITLFNKSKVRLTEMIDKFKEMLGRGEKVAFATKRIRNCEENLKEEAKLITYYTDRRDSLVKRFQFKTES